MFTFNQIRGFKDGEILKQATRYSAGADIRYDGETTVINPNESLFYETKLSMKRPNEDFDYYNYYLAVKSRSSLLKKGLIVDGVIDKDYRGNIGVIVWNVSKNPIKIQTGDRIAQIIVCLNLPFDNVTTERIGGFGSTGQ